MPPRSTINGRLIWAVCALVAAGLALWRVESNRLATQIEVTDRPGTVIEVQRRTEGLWATLDLESLPGVVGAAVDHGVHLDEGDRILVSGAIEPVGRPGRLTGFLDIEHLRVTRQDDGLRARLRRGFRSLCRSHLDTQAADLMPALLLGDRETFEGSRHARFRLTGTLHYLALSGLHLGLLVLPLVLVLRSLRWSPRRQFVAVIPCVLAYLWLTGPIPSLVRAVVTLSLLASAHVLRRGIDTISALLAAMTACLMLQPDQVVSAGFAMTFGALGGILLVGPVLTTFVDRWQSNRFWRSVAVNTGAWLGIAPVLLVTFGEVHPVALALNLVLLVPVTLLLLAGLALPLLPGALSVAVNDLWWIVDGILTGALRYGRQPLGPDRPWPVAIALAIWLTWLVVRRPRPLRWTAAGAALLWLSSWSGPLYPSDGPRVTQLDVGQGSSYLVESGDGSAILVDCGGSKRHLGQRILVPALRRRGIRRIEGILLTHLDRDHRSGLEDIVSRWPVGWIGWNEQGADPAAVADVSRLTRRHRIARRTLESGSAWSWKGLTWTLWHPRTGSPGPENERSLVAHVAGPRRSILFTGDIDDIGTRDLLLSRRAGPISIMTAPHHGSANRWSRLLLRELDPEEIWLSARRGFPTEETVLEHPGCRPSWEGEVESPL